MNNMDTMSKFNCPQCGKNVNEVINCSKIENKTCFFDVKTKGNSTPKYLIAFIIAIVSIFFLGKFGFLFMELPIIIILMIILSKQYAIYDKSNNACLIYKLFNFNILTNVYIHLGEVTVNSKNETNYPASILLVKDSPPSIDLKKLMTNIIQTSKNKDFTKDITKEYSSQKELNNGEELFLGTVLNLISQKEIIVKKMKKDFYFFNNKMNVFSDKIQYHFFIGEKRNDTPKGELEKRILKALLTFNDKANFKNTIAPDIKYLLIMAFDKDENSPEKWLCDLVREEGNSKNFFVKVDAKKNIFKLKNEYSDIFEKERYKIKDIENNLNFYYPELLNEFKKSIKAGFVAREVSSD